MIRTSILHYKILDKLGEGGPARRSFKIIVEVR
jgi:hypothetical protein